MCAFHSVRNKTLKREKENFQKFPQKFNRCPKRSYLRTNEQSSLSLCPRQRQSKGKFSSFCLGREKPWLELSEGRSGRRILLDSSYQSCTKDAFEKARKGREFDTAKLLPGRDGVRTLFRRRESEGGRPCWVASAIFGRTRTKKAG